MWGCSIQRQDSQAACLYRCCTGRTAQACSAIASPRSIRRRRNLGQRDLYILSQIEVVRMVANINVGIVNISQIEVELNAHTYWLWPGVCVGGATAPNRHQLLDAHRRKSQFLEYCRRSGLTRYASFASSSHSSSRKVARCRNTGFLQDTFKINAKIAYEACWRYTACLCKQPTLSSRSYAVCTV